RLQKQYVDLCADRRSVQLDVRRLQHIDLANEVRADRRKIDGATASGCGNVAPVKEGVFEVPTEAADGDAICIASNACPLNRNARDPLNGGSHVRIGELADVLGGNRVHHAG